MTNGRGWLDTGAIVPPSEVTGTVARRMHKGPRFQNDAERECARLFDYHGVAWEYEPHTFPLEVSPEGGVLEAFTPDFYLPEQDLYVEVTTMKQSLVTKKNRKVRRLRELYPDVRIRIFYRRDLDALADRHGLRLPA